MEVLDPTGLVEIKESMGCSENPMSHISKSLKLLKIHKKTYLGGVNEGILQDHIMSLKQGLEFLRTFLQVSENKDLRQRIECSVSYVRKKLYSLGYLLKDENLVTKLEHAYADLREEMKNVMRNPGTNEYDVIFPKTFTWGYVFGKTSLFLCEKVKKLMNTECKANKIRPMLKELEDVRKMLTYYLEPFFIYAKDADRNLSVKEEDKKIFATITAVLDRATCISYLSFVGKINDKMILSFKNSLSNLIIEETRIVKMYLILDIDSIGNLESHISMSLRLLEWKKRSYLDTEMGARLEDHFLSINNGLQLLVKILKMSTDIDLKWRIQHLVVIIKQKLYSLQHNQKNENLMVNMDHANGESRILRMPHGPHLVAIVKQKLHSLLNNHKDENLIVNLEHLFGELRKDMQNVVIKPGTKDNYTLFPEILMNGHGFSTSKDLSKTIDFLVRRIGKLVTSSCKADQIAPIMNELEELGKKLKSLRPFFDYVMSLPNPFALKKEEEKIFAALTTFVNRATCLIYLSLVGKLNEDMLVLLRKNFSLLIEESEIKEMSLVLGIIFDEDLESDIDISLSLLERQGACQIGSMDEVILKDDIMSLKHAIEFLKWLPKIFTDRDFERRIILLSVNVKQELESLTHKQGSESLNMDVNCAYADLREQMKNVILGCDTLLADLYPRMSYFRGENDFILEKIRILLTSNCKADQIAPLKKELEELQKMLTSLKPLCRYVGREIHSLGNVDNIITTLLTFHHKATFLVYLSFIRKMDKEIVLSIKSDISTAMKEIDVREMYTMIFNHFLSDSRYLKDELYLLENLIVLLKSNVGSLNNACSKLYEVLIDIQIFLLGLYPNMFLRKLHLLAPSLEAILGHSIPIVCSCYLEHVEEDISAELKCVHDLIKYIKFESQEMKLYYFPRADDLGFVEFFSGYLEDLMKTQEISLEEEIGALHFEVHSLMSMAKLRNRELNGTPWSDVINMAYQAEYIIDLYLLRSSRDLGLIESLSKIIKQLKNIREDVHGLSCRSLPAQDVAVISNPQVINNDAIVDLQDEAKIIAEYLLTGENKLDVISIVGMAGVGKTTLASTLFKSTPSITNHFDIRAWCTISQSYKSRDLLLTMLDQVNAFDKNHRSILDDEELADHFCKCLKKLRYLVVLDDIWDTGLWGYLKFYLPDDKNGSRILITTRNRDVADNIKSKVNELHQLSEEKSLILFQKMMLRKENVSKDLLKISKGIVEHCKGLPLSIIIIAGILSNMERTKEKWNQIEASVSSLVLSDPQGKCKAILELSYNHLPNHLKMCFLYMGLFPEDGEILVNHLIILWIAEGLVKDTKSNSAEEVAKKYMDDLIVKSLVIPIKERSGGGVKSFRLHDLLRDFCLDKAKEKHFFTLLDKRNHSRPLQDPRRLIINGPCISGINYSCHSIRSMICFDELEASEIEKGIGSCDMVLLEVLEVVGVWSVIFPNISRLIHLRYLALSFLNQKIYGLPSSISKLKNLQILILRCKYNVVIVVPDFIWDMVKLRRVHISPEASFQVDSKRLQNSSFLLENLISLSNARVSYGDSKLLNKLPGLQRVRCFFVDDLEGDDDLGQDADLEHNDDLKQDDDLESDDDSEKNQSRMLSFNGHLTSLNVDNKTSPKQRFISTCQLPISLRKLTLSKFFFTSNDISKMGRALPHLEVFKLHSCYLPSGYNWVVGNEEFPELKVLKLRDLKISNWIASEYCFPKLEQLWVEHCNYLEEIPLDFGYLLNLRLLSVRECAPSVDDSAREIEKMQHEDQNTEMRVHIYPRKGNPDT